MEFEKVALSEVPWQELDRLPDRTIFQTLPWLHFLKETQGGEPIVAVARDNDGPCAYLTGLVVRRWGLRMFGAPLKGWTTISMGFNRLQRIDNRALLEAAIRFVFHRLGCRHLEIVDPELGAAAADIRGSLVQAWNTWIVDLTRDEDELFMSLSKSCRWSIRKARRVGVQVEQASEESFIDDYYDQLLAVFTRRNLVPTYPRRRVEALFRHLGPTKDLLLLRALEPNGRCIATGIFPGNQYHACFWGGASWREELSQCPNEALMWHAMLHWKARGARLFDLGGAAAFKRKYRGELVTIPRFLLSRPSGLLRLRNTVAGAFRIRQRILGQLTRSGGPAARRQ